MTINSLTNNLSSQNFNKTGMVRSTPYSPVASQGQSKLDHFVYSNALSKNTVRFGSPVPIPMSVDIQAIKKAHSLNAKVISTDANFDASVVRMGSTFENNFLKLLSPNMDLALVRIHNNNSNQFTASQLSQLQANIVKPISHQLAEQYKSLQNSIHSLRENMYASKFDDANTFLERASVAKNNKDFQHYVKLAELNFTSVKNNPPNFEMGVNAHLGLATCLKLLGGYDSQYKTEYYAALGSMSVSSKLMTELAEKAAKDPEKKAALIKDLIFLQEHCGAADAKGIYDTNKYLKSAEISKNFVTARLKTKDLRNIYFSSSMDLKGYNLSGIDFTNSNLTHLDLEGADFSHSNLSNANINHTNCSNANFQNVIGFPSTIEGINFTNANLSLPKLLLKAKNCNFENTNFGLARMGGSEFTNCLFNGANFSRANVSRDSNNTLRPMFLKDCSNINLATWNRGFGSLVFLPGERYFILNGLEDTNLWYDEYNKIRGVKNPSNSDCIVQ